MTPAQQPARGAALLVAAMAGFAVSDAFAKRLSADLSPIVLAWLRYVGLLVTVLPIAIARPRILKSAAPGLQVVRAAALVGSALLFLQAIRRLPVAEATAMVFASPLFVTVLSAWVLGERIGWRRALPVALGFAGVLVVVRPGFAQWGGAEVFPLASSFCWACAVIGTRRLGESDPPSTTMLYSSVLGCGMLSAALPAIDLSTVLRHAPEVAAMMGAWCAAQWCSIAAYRWASPGSIAPFSYSQLLWASLLGAALFGHWPDGVSLAGIATIVAAGALASRMSPRR